MTLRLCLVAVVAGGLLSGCGTTMKEIHHHPEQGRLMSEVPSMMVLMRQSRIMRSTGQGISPRSRSDVARS